MAFSRALLNRAEAPKAPALLAEDQLENTLLTRDKRDTRECITKSRAALQARYISFGESTID